VRIEELKKANAAKAEKATEIEEKPKKRGRHCKKKRDAKDKAGEFEDTSDQDEETLDAKVKKPRKKLVKLRNACPEREQDVLAIQMKRIELKKSIPFGMTLRPHKK